MKQLDFMNSTIPDRIYIILNDKDVEHIYDLLKKSTGTSKEKLKSKFKIEVNTIRRRIEVDGSEDDIFTLFNHLYSKSLKFESITPKHLRIDLYEFINKII